MPIKIAMKTIILTTIFFGLSGVAYTETVTPGQLDRDARRYSVSTKKCFDDVIEDIEFAIGQHNYRITGRNNIGKAISKWSDDSYPESIILHFCSIGVAKKVYDINPDFLLHMPCRITVRKAAGTVIIEARLIPENDPKMHQLALAINRMMRNIADYGAK